MRCKSLAMIVLLLGVFSPQEASWARTDAIKQPCANCHTMHNSQGGAPVFGDGSVQQPALLTNTCYGCHSGDNVAGGMPMVFNATPTEPFYMDTGTEFDHKTLAGGSFSWAEGNPLTGHNVIGLAAPEYRTPPGGTRTFGPGPETALTCAGTYGCHGDLSVASDILAIYQTHHAAEQTQPMDGSSLVKSYRLLNGIAGYEDPDYEFTVSSSDHNQYKGVARGEDTDPGTSISHSCAVCHGNFHSGAGDAGIAGASFASPWLRHPVDYAMGLTGEYGGYGGSGVNAYNVATPLGSNDVTTRKDVVSGAGNAIIVCVTCHRAHGSPYDYSLRWNYLSWPTEGHNGCGDCHTEKN